MCGLETERAISLDTIPLHSTNLLTLIDRDGTIQYESPSIERVLGYDQDALVGSQFTDNVHADDHGRVAQLLEELIDGQENVRSVKYRHEQPNGGYVRVKSTGSTTPTSDGQYVINTDVSEQRTVERDSVTTNEQPYEFAKVVSHDLRNPLNVASGNVELLREKLDSDSENGERLEAVMRAHERMEKLIQNLLILTQSGGRVTDVEPIDLLSLCERCWQNVLTANATLVTDVDGSIRANPSRLQQLLENLIRNAVEHGGEDVTVTIGKLDDSSGFYVADNGPGIEESKRDSVFESGFSTREGGTGFGLAIVSEIVAAHGWQIDVTESRDGGTRFEISGVDWDVGYG